MCVGLTTPPKLPSTDCKTLADATADPVNFGNLLLAAFDGADTGDGLTAEALVTVVSKI